MSRDPFKPHWDNHWDCEMFGHKPYDEQRFRDTLSPGHLGRAGMLPKAPGITRDHLTYAESLSFDPFGLTEPLTGRYDETRVRKEPKLRRGGGAGAGIRLPPCQKCQAENSARYDQSDTEGKEYCPSCRCFVPVEEIVDHPLRDPYWLRICTCCASEVTKDLRKCPNCSSWCSDSEWVKCDRCSREWCSVCSDVSPAPQTSGYWLEESYGSLCSECYQEVEEEHNRRREDEAAEAFNSSNED